MFEERDYKFTIVFDGTSPPAKQGTSSARAKSRVNARIANHLRNQIEGEVYISPCEADPQIVMLQNIYLEMGAGEVYVYATDSDLIVLGAKKLLYDVQAVRGSVTGRCIETRLLFAPTAWSLGRDTPGHAWLRQLHGLPKDAQHLDPMMELRPLPAALATSRLLLYAIVVGNDYANFENIGPVRAADLVLTPVEDAARDSTFDASPDFDAVVGELAERVIAASQKEDTPVRRRDIENDLRKCNIMFKHAVVWNPIEGVLQHASGACSSTDISVHTGEK